MAVAGKKKTVPEIFGIAQICKDYGWTWEQYYEQPDEFIEIIAEKMKIEGAAEKRDLERMNNKVSRMRR